MQGAEECGLRRMSNTPQGEAIEGNAADDALMVEQGDRIALDIQVRTLLYSSLKMKGFGLSSDSWLD